MTPALLDRINALVDLACFAPAILDIRLMLRTRSVEGVSRLGRALYFVVSLWWLYYFAALGQFYSFVIVTGWAVLFGVEAWMVVAWSKRA